MGLQRERSETGAASSPPQIVLRGDPDDPRPPVRIYLGTELAQQRAERVFVYSIEQVRDPRRTYEITLMRGLPGFRTTGWATGFTNYRFAVPELAGFRGRAIYNDEDQIYLRDPGELFDLEIGSHGYLAIAERETSVMLLDCARMSAVWTLADAQRMSKKQLIARGLEVPGLWGALDLAWNCRDEDEYEPERAACYHFTTLHTQPWRPFPERFVYHQHPHRELWFSLERSAEAEGFQLFDRERPSEAFEVPLPEPPRTPDAGGYAEALREMLEESGAQTLWAFGATPLSAAPDPEQVGSREIRCAALQSLREDVAASERRDAVLCLSGLGEVPADDVAWVVEALFARALGRVFIVAPERPRRWAPPWRSPYGGVGDADWWIERFRSAARRHPHVSFELVLERTGSTSRRFVRGGPREASRTPRVWVLAGEGSPASASPALALAQALGWPFEQKRLRYSPLYRGLARWLGCALRDALIGARPWGLAADCDPLAPPWPDLVIASGADPVSRWIRARSEGRARIVRIDADGTGPADRYDLVVTPASLGALAHPHRVETALPLRVASPDAGSVVDVADASSPQRIALFVQGALADDASTLAWAEALGEDVGKLASRLAASTCLALDASVPSAVERALYTALPDAVHVSTSGGNVRARRALLDSLSEADVIVAACDEDWLAELHVLGKPIALPDAPPARLLSRAERLRAWLSRRAYARPENDRGTTRPQRGLERALSRLIAHGILLPPRESARARELLFARKLVAPLAGATLEPPAPGAETRAVAERVRGLVTG